MGNRRRNRKAKDGGDEMSEYEDTVCYCLMPECKRCFPNGKNSGVDDFIRFHHNPIVKQKNEEIKALEARVKELEGV